MVNEAVPHEQAYARGLQIATKLGAKPGLYRRLQKQTLNRRVAQELGVPTVPDAADIYHTGPAQPVVLSGC